MYIKFTEVKIVYGIKKMVLCYVFVLAWQQHASINSYNVNK